MSRGQLGDNTKRRLIQCVACGQMASIKTDADKEKWKNDHRTTCTGRKKN